MTLKRFILYCLLLSVCFSAIPVSAQAQNNEFLVADLLDKMSPVEKVGQLMLVSFDGTNSSDTSEIFELINNYHIGGVVLSTANGNFEAENSTEAVKTLISSLQDIAYQKSIIIPEFGLSSAGSPVYIPLYIGYSQHDEADYSSKLLPSLKNLPSQMTLSATWKPDLAKSIGQVYGEELASLGFNLFIGPNLDLINSTETNISAYDHTDSFGSNPYWVGQMGQAFVQGLHSGSANRMTVIATHFPGLGSADRPLSQELSTIQRTLDQLKENELVPFMRVSEQSNIEDGRVDGMLISHIRFQGLQGNVRSNTRPISFDPTALQQLLELDPIRQWRIEGGLLISDSLGSQAVRSFFDPNNIAFDGPSIARIAFMAGNDMLYLDNFSGSAYESSTETIKRTINFFAQKVQEDPVFAQLVDESVTRILNNKLALYGDFSLKNISPVNSTPVSTLNQNQINLEVARESLTLLSPKQDFLNTIFTEGPSSNDYITVFSDSRTIKPCETCEPLTTLSFNDFENTLLSLYGPQATNQLSDPRIYSYNFAQLSDYLDGREESSTPYIEEHIRRSQWIVFNIQDLDPEIPSSYALKRILKEKESLLRDKMVIVFAYSAPYYLDSTEVTKLSAYFGLFTPSKASLEVASRVLMLEARSRGALPFSLASVAYNLNEQLSPDPNQIINLALITEQGQAQSLSTPDNQTSTPDPEILETPVPLFRLGEAVRIQAGPILDLNGHIVPDGTLTRFTIRMATDQLIISQPEVGTINGYATIDYRVEREGIFEVTSGCGNATTSATLILTTQGGLAQILMPISTPLPEPSSTPEPSPTPQPTPTPEPEPEEEAPATTHPSGYPSLNDWLLTIMILITGFGIAYALAYYWWKGHLWGIRSGICTVLGGLIAYLLLGIGLPGLGDVIRQSGTWFVIQMSGAGMFLGWLGSLIWWLREKRFKS